MGVPGRGSGQRNLFPSSGHYWRLDGRREVGEDEGDGIGSLDVCPEPGCILEKEEENVEPEQEPPTLLCLLPTERALFRLQVEEPVEAQPSEACLRESTLR